jgi:hypothetical protein
MLLRNATAACGCVGVLSSAAIRNQLASWRTQRRLFEVTLGSLTPLLCAPNRLLTPLADQYQIGIATTNTSTVQHVQAVHLLLQTHLILCCTDLQVAELPPASLRLLVRGSHRVPAVVAERDTQGAAQLTVRIAPHVHRHVVPHALWRARTHAVALRDGHDAVTALRRQHMRSVAVCVAQRRLVLLAVPRGRPTTCFHGAHVRV